MEKKRKRNTKWKKSCQKENAETVLFEIELFFDIETVLPRNWIV